jgi:hypothetical protein
MLNNFNLEKLSYYIFNTHESILDHSEIVNEAYLMWKDVWSSALMELEGSDKIHSDDFSRHQQVGALFYNKEPIGLCLFSSVDLNLQVWRDDSYFKSWPEELLKNIGKNNPGKKILICCYFTLSKKWRRGVNGVNFKNVLTGIAVKHFIHSDCDLMVGTMRKDRGMDKMTYQWGATPVLQDQTMHGVLVDLVLFDKKECEKAPSDIYVERAWKNLNVLPLKNNTKQPKAI